VVGPLVIVVENQSSLAAYSIDNGELVWKTPAIEGTNYVTFSIRSIAFDDQNLYTARFDWGLSAYDLKTGEMIWRQNLPSRTSPHIAVGKSFVLLVAGKKISAFDAKSGSKLWDKEVGGYMGPILLDGNTLYASDEEKAKLFSLDLDSGKINWEKSYSTIKSSEYYCISEFENNLLIAAQELLMVSKVNGEIIWATDELGILDCAIVFKDSVYVRTASTNLFSIDGKTGLEKGRLFIQVDSQMTHDFFRSPVVVNGLLVVPFGDDRIFVYQQ
jgi:outer membrane protein assembly factor BamB